MEILRELQLLRVTREVQAVISKGGPNGGAVGAGTLHPASQELQTIENLMKHNDRSEDTPMLSCEIDPLVRGASSILLCTETGHTCDSAVGLKHHCGKLMLELSAQRAQYTGYDDSCCQS